ncbi:DNA processing protein [Parapedobacter composti]|uniref:DNA processing protein n=2 Tax=Parapedobacter composti TaxID=623281 RepID=A0A1I1HUJ3_9SPHI|nr:DNA-processing protein DprA [Parapedobacter composti]SFC27475.1 DNA processing protein [Parapedobacter composti]
MNLLHYIALTKVRGIGPVIGRHLIDYFGDAATVFTAPARELMAIPGIGPRLAESITDARALHEAENELSFIEKHSIQALVWGTPDYPKRLAECSDAPLLLYYKGVADLNASPTVSIVGTRNATAYGKSICTALVGDLKPYRPVIVSGLAYGIDSCAHRAALEHDIPTIGVLGHGLDRIYPAANRGMAAKMLECGGLLTEFPSGTTPDRQNFPMRNRIIAGLADVTIVVEAAHKGGALITAEIANTYNRDVCAFPGNVGQASSAGCNYLIKTNRAHLITGARDVEYLMNWEPQSQPTVSQTQLLQTTLTDAEQEAYKIIQEAGKIGVDDLSSTLQWPQSKLAITLLEMEMKGVITALPGKVYRIIS